MLGRVAITPQDEAWLKSGGSDLLAFGRQRLFTLVVGAILLFVVPNFISEFRQNLLAKLLTYAILAIGLDLVWGYGGMLSLGQGVFFGIGGYAMAMHLKLVASDGVLPDFMTWSGLHELPWFWKPFESGYLAIVVAVIAPGILAFLLGFMVFRSRVKGVYFSIITQALALVLSTFFVSQQPYTGGTNGLTNYTTLFGKHLIALDTQQLLYTVTVLVLMATYLVAWWITRSRFGRLLIAVRDDEDRVRFSGYNVALIKAVIFGVSGAMAGIAGALFVPQVGIISPANLGIVPSIEMVIWVAVGGRASLSGAVIGALVVGFARSYLSEEFPDIWLYFLGSLFIGTVVLFPTGIVGTVREGIDWMKARMGSLPRRGGSTTATPAVGVMSHGD
jgi:urea transport system permease protein